jgi:hypothetical protein
MKNDDGGVFYIDKDTFMDAFVIASISHYFKDWTNSYATIQHDEGKP